MGNLNLVPPDANKHSDDRLGDAEYNLITIQDWANTIQNKMLVDLKKNFNNQATSSLNYTPIPNMFANFNGISSNALVILNLPLSGEGYIGVFINNKLQNERYFLHNASISTLSFQGIVPLGKGTNNINLQYKAVTGSINLTNEATLQVMNSIS